MYCSTMPSDCGCQVVVCVLQFPKCCNTCRSCDSKVLTLVIMLFPWDSEVAEEVGHQMVHHC
jgi:hypothetical protein